MHFEQRLALLEVEKAIPVRPIEAKPDVLANRFKEAEFAAEANGYTATRHQREVGTGYFDAISIAISGGTSSTTALKDSTEAEQFKKKAALATAAE